jgi:cation diffusion facilitator family transporter
MEGALIVVAAGYIIYEAVVKWLAGLAVQNLSTGTFLVAGAAVLNAGLGFYLLSEGKRSGSLILIANGRHVLTDVWTSAGVVVGLILTLVTGVLPLDPCVAILVAINILWSGGKLIRQSVGGLMDEGDPALEAAIKNTLDEETHEHGLRYHQLRYRNSGTSLWVELHLLFPAGALLEDAHRSATAIERAVSRRLSMPVHIVTHLEPQDQHDQAHVESPHM